MTLVYVDEPDSRDQWSSEPQQQRARLAPAERGAQDHSSTLETVSGSNIGSLPVMPFFTSEDFEPHHGPAAAARQDFNKSSAEAAAWSPGSAMSWNGAPSQSSASTPGGVPHGSPHAETHARAERGLTQMPDTRMVFTPTSDAASDETSDVSSGSGASRISSPERPAAAGDVNIEVEASRGVPHLEARSVGGPKASQASPASAWLRDAHRQGHEADRGRPTGRTRIADVNSDDAAARGTDGRTSLMGTWHSDARKYGHSSEKTSPAVKCAADVGSGGATPRSAEGRPESRSVPIAERLSRHSIKQCAASVASRRKRFMAAYVRKVPVRCPCCCILCVLVVVGLIIGVGMVLFPMEVETDFSAFMKTDVNTSTMRDAFLYALEHRSEGRRLQATMVYKVFDLSIAYEFNEDSGHRAANGIFDFEVLSEVSRFEQRLRELPAWRDMCEMSVEGEDRRLCDPGMTLVNYMFPSNPGSRHVPSSLRFDGLGSEGVPPDIAFELAETQGMAPLLLPLDFGEPGAPAIFRTVFRFKIMCCSSMAPVSERRRLLDGFSDRWRALLRESVLPMLQDAAEGRARDRDTVLPMRVYFDGTDVQEIEVMQTLRQDVNLAFASMAFVLAYLIAHTRSVPLSLVAILVIILSVPLALVVSGILGGVTTISIASFLSFFLVVGLGSDVVFVYVDFWKESQQQMADIHERAVWTYGHAGKASLATAATTAVSFFANLASVLKPLREFGFFMGLCVMLVWLLLSIVLVPLCILNERFCGRCDLRCPKASQCQVTSGWCSDPISTWTRWLHTWRRTCVFLTLLVAVGQVIWAMSSMETDTGVPNIFPRDHNQNHGREVLGNFAALEDELDLNQNLPPRTINICSEHAFGSNDARDCALFWCEVEEGSERAPDGTCECFHNLSPDRCSSGSQVALVQRFVGPDRPLTAGYGDELRHYIGNVSAPLGEAAEPLAQWAGSDLAPLLLHEWERGDMVHKPMSEFRSSVARRSALPCGWQGLCFCGTYSCKLPAPWVRGQPLQVDSDGARRLPAAVNRFQVPTSSRAVVDVIFGLEMTPRSPLLGQADLASAWSFIHGHDMRQPWAQRNLYSFCKGDFGGMRVTERRCWILDFRNWILTEKTSEPRFPVRVNSFTPLLLEFAQRGITGGLSSQDYMWMRGDELRASYAVFAIDVHQYTATQVALDHKERWDEHLERYNADASQWARGAWHSSDLWVRAQAQEELISSTKLTLLIVLLLAFLGMWVFTCDCLLALYVVLATTGVVCGLAFFIIVVMGWPIGPIEVIALIVFIGYAVTYSLHIAHRYGCPDAVDTELAPMLADEATTPKAKARIQRVSFALSSIGRATLGSAITTAGCSMFLLFCTLTIFQKLGSVVFAVTLMSIVTALVPLPAMLLLAGPEHPGRCACALNPDSIRDTAAGCAERLSALGQRRWYPRASADGHRSAAATHSAGATVVPTGGAEGHGSDQKPQNAADDDFTVGTEEPLEPIWWHEIRSAGMIHGPEPEKEQSPQQGFTI